MFHRKRVYILFLQAYHSRMVKVECFSGYKINERPVAFHLIERGAKRSFQVQELIDSWYGETADYFKVKADDDNIYLLKYDGNCDQWDLIFYQDARKMDILQPPGAGVKPPFYPVHGNSRVSRSIPIH